MNLKLGGGIALVIGALVFSVQNAAPVTVQVLGWAFSVSLALILFAAVAAGLIGGWAVTSAMRRRDRPSPAPGRPSPRA